MLLEIIEAWKLTSQGRLLSTGTPVGGWRVQVLDRGGQPAAAGEIGEIAIAGGSLFHENKRPITFEEWLRALIAYE